MINYRVAMCSLAALLSLATFTKSVHASFIFNMSQVCNSVVVNGSGTINTTALTPYVSVPTEGAGVDAGYGILNVGPVSQSPIESFSGLVGPTEFSGGHFTSGYSATSGGGDSVGIGLGAVYVPSGYLSGSLLSDSDTYSRQSFSSLGVIPGTYIYTWGSGPTADSLTLNIGTVPEPASLAMLGVPAALALLRRRRV